MKEQLLLITLMLTFMAFYLFVMIGDGVIYEMSSSGQIVILIKTASVVENALSFVLDKLWVLAGAMMCGLLLYIIFFQFKNKKHERAIKGNGLQSHR